MSIVNGAILGKVTWGWMFHSPPDAQLKQLQSALGRALGEHSNASPDLRSILRGHSLHVGFRILQANVRTA